MKIFDAGRGKLVIIKRFLSTSLLLGQGSYLVLYSSRHLMEKQVMDNFLCHISSYHCNHCLNHNLLGLTHTGQMMCNSCYRRDFHGKVLLSFGEKKYVIAFTTTGCTTFAMILLLKKNIRNLNLQVPLLNRGFSQEYLSYINKSQNLINLYQI